MSDFGGFFAALNDSRDSVASTIFYEYAVDESQLVGGRSGNLKSFYGFQLSSSDTIDAVRLTISDLDYNHDASGFSYSLEVLWEVLGTRQASAVAESGGGEMILVGLAMAACLVAVQPRRSVSRSAAAQKA